VKNIGDLILSVETPLEAIGIFNTWSDVIVRKVESDRKNLEDPQISRRILVILNHIGHSTERKFVSRKASCARETS